MSKTIVELSMSLDGFVAGPNDNPDNGLGDGGEALFAWYYNGDTAVPLPGTDMQFMVAPESAELIQREWAGLGAMIAGRRMFDIAHAWGGYPPGGGPTFIMTHNPPAEWTHEGSPFTFVTDGIESAVRQAKAAAGGKVVSISSASVAQQCLKAGLLDEILIHMAPVLLGGGVSLFGYLGVGAIPLEKIEVIDVPGMTHMRYRVVR